MKLIVIETCECDSNDCPNGKPVILCLMAEDSTEIQTLNTCQDDCNYQIEKVKLPSKLAERFWNELETQQKTFQIGKTLMSVT